MKRKSAADIISENRDRMHIVLIRPLFDTGCSGYEDTTMDEKMADIVFLVREHSLPFESIVKEWEKTCRKFIPWGDDTLPTGLLRILSWLKEKNEGSALKDESAHDIIKKTAGEKYPEVRIQVTHGYFYEHPVSIESIPVENINEIKKALEIYYREVYPSFWNALIEGLCGIISREIDEYIKQIETEEQKERKAEEEYAGVYSVENMHQRVHLNRFYYADVIRNAGHIILSNHRIGLRLYYEISDFPGVEKVIDDVRANFPRNVIDNYNVTDGAEELHLEIFGPAHGFQIVKAGGRTLFKIFSTHHGFGADASSSDSELSQIIEYIAGRYPEIAFDSSAVSRPRKKKHGKQRA